MGKPSRDKGKRGELDLCRFLRDQGFDARRGVQYQGGPESPDVRVADLPWLHLECKRCERLSIYDAMAQAVADCDGCGYEHRLPLGVVAVFDQIPVVAHRRNDRAWLAVLTLKDLCRLLREIGPEGPGGPT